MAAYSAWMNLGAGVTWDSFALSEQHIYGSSRVGYALPGLMLHPTVPENPHALDSCRYVTFEGWKRYEISNHLGNVLAVISDRKHGKAVSGTDIQWFEAEVFSAQQYYPFGMLMPGDTSPEVRRQYALNGYDHRYGFNGKEGDDEVKGDDNQQDYGMRIYDPRVGRFLSVDPIAREYPWYTPYQFAGNMPIWAVDLDGLEPAFPGKDGEFETAPDQSNGNRYGWTFNNNDWRRGLAEVTVTATAGKTLEFSDIVKGTGSPSAQLWRDGYIRTNYYLPMVNDFKQLHQAENLSDGTYSMLRYQAQKATKMQLSNMGQAISETPPYGKPLAQQKALAEAVAAGEMSFPKGALGTRASTTKIATVAQIGGKALVVTSAAMSVHHIVTAEDTGLAISQEAGGWTGAWLGAEGGAATGAAFGVWFSGVGAVPGAVIGGFIGGIGGYLGGYKVGGFIYRSNKK